MVGTRKIVCGLCASMIRSASDGSKCRRKIMVERSAMHSWAVAKPQVWNIGAAR